MLLISSPAPTMGVTLPASLSSRRLAGARLKRLAKGQRIPDPMTHRSCLPHNSTTPTHPPSDTPRETHHVEPPMKTSPMPPYDTGAPHEARNAMI